MERRKNLYTISKPQLQQKSTDVYQAPVPPRPSNGPRPLSDIRELSEPSIIDTVAHPAHFTHERNFSARKPTPLRPSESPRAGSSARSRQVTEDRIHNQPPPLPGDGSSSYSSTPEQSSFYTIPYSSVPRRSSSQTHVQRPARNHARKPSIRIAPPPTFPKSDGFTVPNHGQSHSPVKQVATRWDAVKSDAGRSAPSRTYIRTPRPVDILEFPSYRHPRVKLELRVSAPLFVGGGSIEGLVHVTIDENERGRSRRSLAMGELSVDLLGFEDMPNGRRAPFLTVGTDLIDSTHPPPTNSIEPPNPLAPEERFWTLTPCSVALPFMISLPLDTGPPPFRSKIANIRFLLCATAVIGDAGKLYRVRTSQNVNVIATYDPEKALTSLISPLTAVDELLLPRFGRCEILKVTAGLHRQVWVSGSSIFVDVHIVNKTHKTVKRLEMNLERDILCYKHPPAGTGERSASHARIFESNEQTMVARSVLKPGQQGWNGVPPHSSETRTCELELPRGHATVRCGKYFEVRFFLNVTASVTNTKLVAVQLPIILIHMNSLDILPNSVAQVAAAIEEKRSRGERDRERTKRHERWRERRRSSSSPVGVAEANMQPSYSQGRAFVVPREQSAHRLQTMKSDLEDLGQVLDSSPRKYEPRMQGTVIRKIGSTTTVGAISQGERRIGMACEPSHKGYKTPPPSRSGRDGGHSSLAKMASLNPLPRMQSLDSMWSRKSSKLARAQARKPDQNIKPQYHFTLPQSRIEPHTLSLTSSNRRGGDEEKSDPLARPGTGLSFREQMDGKRFDFKSVGKKASGSLKERSLNWLEHVKPRQSEREGWI